MTARLEVLATEAAERAYAGQHATAVKRGRDPRWPYVPVIHHDGTVDLPREWTEQVRGRAYASRDESIAAAEAVLQFRRFSLAGRLAMPNRRALRAAHGLPRDIEAVA